jgi:hypothetical protein
VKLVKRAFVIAVFQVFLMLDAGLVTKFAKSPRAQGEVCDEDTENWLDDNLSQNSSSFSYELLQWTQPKVPTAMVVASVDCGLVCSAEEKIEFSPVF